MDITFLGTGSSIGMPIVAFEHEGVNMDDPRNWRTRASLHVTMDGHPIQVDAGQEFRLQCLRENITDIQTFILTHEHADHVLGMEDLRRYCTQNEQPLPIYSHAKGLQRVREVYPYAITETPRHHGYAAFSLREVESQLALEAGQVQFVSLPHGDMNTLGLIFEEQATGRRLAYYTDCKAVPDEAIEMAKGVDVAVLDALYFKPHRSHMSVDEAVDTAQKIGAKVTYLTHLTYPVDHVKLEQYLPSGIYPAYDGLKLQLQL